MRFRLHRAARHALEQISFVDFFVPDERSVGRHYPRLGGPALRRKGFSFSLSRRLRHGNDTHADFRCGAPRRLSAHGLHARIGNPSDIYDTNAIGGFDGADLVGVSRESESGMG